MRNHILIFMESEQGRGQAAAAVQLAKSLEEKGFSVTLATGNEKMVADCIERYDCRRTRIYTLPPLAHDKNNTTIDYSHMNPDTGAAYSSDIGLQRERGLALLRLMGAVDFGAIILESMPFEKHDLLETDVEALLRNNKSQAPVFSLVRDVAITSEWKAARTADFINQNCKGGVIVRGDAALPLSASFSEAEAITWPVFHAGYFCAPVPARDAPTGEVLVAFGGKFGAHDKTLLEKLAKARRLSPELSGKPWRALVGGNYPEDAFNALKAQMAEEGIVVQRNSPDYPHMLANCDLAISAGGYNTTAELLRLRQENGSPAAVLLSRQTPLDLREQKPRQEFLSRQGIMLVTEELDPSALAGKLTASLHDDPSERRAIDFSGAAKAADFIVERIRSLTPDVKAGRAA